MNRTEKVVLVFVFLIIAAIATELLNYKDWILFTLGIVSEIVCLLILIKLLKSLFTTKNKSNE